MQGFFYSHPVYAEVKKCKTNIFCRHEIKVQVNLIFVFIPMLNLLHISWVQVHKQEMLFHQYFWFTFFSLAYIFLISYSKNSAYKLLRYTAKRYLLSLLFVKFTKEWPHIKILEKLFFFFFRDMNFCENSCRYNEMSDMFHMQLWLPH